MVHRILIGIAIGGLAAAVVSGCRSKKSDDASAIGARGEAAAFNTDAPAEALDETVSSKGAGGTSPYGRGFMYVFGIKIPTGMKPARGPKKVYRFSGKLPPARVASLIREQVKAKSEAPEGEGFLFRFAEARRGATREEANREVAVRIAPTAAGSNLDIWLEREHTNGLPGTEATSDFPMAKQPHSRRTVLTKKARATEQAHRTLLMRSLQKLQRGEPLTPEEAASGVYD